MSLRRISAEKPNTIGLKQVIAFTSSFTLICLIVMPFFAFSIAKEESIHLNYMDSLAVGNGFLLFMIFCCWCLSITAEHFWG